MKSLSSIVVAGLAGFWFCGCNEQVREESQEDVPIPVAKVEDDTPQTSPLKSNADGDVFTRPEVVEIEGVKFTIPAGWKRTDLASGQAGFISARFLIPVEDQELQLTFSTAGGGIAANFDRWRGQFQLEPGIEPLEDLITLVDGQAHWIDLRGTYSAGTGFTSSDPESDVRMIGVGIPLANTAMYLKLLGPSSLVSRITDDMRALVKSADLP